LICLRISSAVDFFLHLYLYLRAALAIVICGLDSSFWL